MESITVGKRNAGGFRTVTVDGEDVGRISRYSDGSWVGFPNAGGRLWLGEVGMQRAASMLAEHHAETLKVEASEPLTDEAFRALLDGIAQDLEGADVIHTGGNIWCVQVDGPGESFALIGEGFDDDESLALGTYTDVTDEGAILKEWAIDGLDASEHADIIRTVLATYWASHR